MVHVSIYKASHFLEKLFLSKAWHYRVLLILAKAF